MTEQETHSYPMTRRQEAPIQRGPVDHSTYGVEQDPQRSVKGTLGARWVWMSVIAVLVFVAIYFAAIQTYLGQYLENAALLGAKSISTTELDEALDRLHVISITSLVVVMVVYVLIGFLRRTWEVAVAGMAILGISAVSAELLKRVILPRPDLTGVVPDSVHNSFPSGHTTIAMAILLSLIVVIAYRWRGWIVGFAMIWAGSVGAATVTARWHRFSDTLGADALALFVAALVTLWLLRRGSIVASGPKTYPIRVIYVVIAGALALGALVIGLILVLATLNNFGIFTELSQAHSLGVTPQLTAHLDPTFNENIFYAAQSLAFAFSTFAALWFWATFHRIQTRG